ncbi:DoxX family protein [Nocardia arizonensis]|uniref:DoxX family protein n=1 Tax=Nocardia arizonensis TaxID=1141647 RepID=UPI0006D0BA4D|nr:DoxX family protein [Nocardia arizonensis]
MSDKPKDTSGPDAPSPGEQEAASTGHGARSPYDSPTGELPRLDLAKEPGKGADVPRTEEELGLEPDVPTVAEHTAATGGTGAAGAGAAGAGAAGAADDTATAPYSYASIPPAAGPPGGPSRTVRRRAVETRRGTLDLGLFLLRLMIGGTFVYHGLQKATGWFNGAGFDGTRDMMIEGGWDHATLSAVLVTVGELGGGALLVLGLATPMAAGAVLAVILDAWMWKQGMVPGFQYRASLPSGVEFESVLAGAATVIILTGPGRWSLDRNRGWAVRPSYGSFVVLLLAIAAAVGTYWYLHGGNPLTGIGPFD